MKANLSKPRTTAKILFAALLITLLSPIQPASSAGETITKTFTIRGADNALLSGAIVRMSWNDEITNANVLSDLSFSNISGVATVTAPKNARFLKYSVAPAAGDIVNAISQETEISSLADEAIAVKLEVASIVINVQKSDGTAMTTSPPIIVPGGEFYRVHRTGPLGVKLPPDLDTNTTYALFIAQITDQYTPGQFSWRYAFKASGNAGSQTYTVYTDLSATTPLVKVNDAFVLKYSGANIAGTLKKSDGTPIAITPGMLISVSVVPDFVTTVQGSGSIDFFDSTSSPNGNWNGRAYGPAGKYKVTFSISGSLTIPSFSTYIWKDSNGGFSTVENGTYTTSAPHALEIRLPGETPNLVIKTVKPGTSEGMGVYASLQVRTPGTENYNSLSGGRAINGVLSSVLANGDYLLTLDPFDNSYSAIVVLINVTSGAVSVTNAAGAPFTPVNGVYTVTPLEPNIKFKAVSASNILTAINDSYVEIFIGADGRGGSVGGRGSGSTFASFNLADGTYMVRVNAGGQQLNYADKTLVVSVANGVPTISGLAALDGVFSVPLDTNNFRYRLFETNGTTPLSNAWIEFCLIDVATGFRSCRGAGANQNGQGGASLVDGTYKITMYPDSSSTNSPRAYDAIVSAGVVTVTGSTAVNGVFPLIPATANLSGLLKDSGGSNNLTFAANQGVNLALQKYVDGNWQWSEVNSWRTSPSYGLNVSIVGQYRLLAQPQGFADLAWSYSETFWAVAAGSGVNLTTVSASDAGTSSLSNFNISVKGANLKLKITDPRDSSLLKFGWVAILKKENNGNQTWVMNADINSNNPGFTGANLVDGKYRLELNPQQGSTIIGGLARQYYDAVVSGTGTVVTVSYKGTALVADGSGRFNLTPASANISGRVVTQSGAAVAPGNNKWVNINVQRYIAAENRWEWSNNWANTDNDGFFSMSVADAGKYRLRIEPNGYSDATVTFSSEFTVTSGSESTFKIAFGNIVMAAPSLKIRSVASGSTTAQTNMGVEIRKNNNWLDWANISQSGVGTVAFKEVGKYQLVVHPNEAALNAGSTRKSYDVVATANSDGTISAAVVGLTANSDGVFTLTLGTGTLAGTIFATDGTTAVRDSQVYAINTVTKQEMWEYSTNSSATGKWSMNLPEGTYSIVAKAPWGTNTYGSSDPVTTVTVNSAGVATLSGVAATSPQTTSAFNILLKAPTWTGQVKAPSPSEVGISFANICLYNDNLWNCATADADGNWALSAPTGFTAFSSNAMFIVSDPRNRTYPELRFDNNQSAESVSTALGGLTATGLTHRFVGANIQITVTAGGVVVPNVWVTIDRPNVGWLAGNSTSTGGVAPLFVANLTLPINVRVELNGNKDVALNYAPTIKYFSLPVASQTVDTVFTATIALDTPNVKAVVKEPTVGGVAGSTAPSSWVELFRDSDNSWVSGSNTDDAGTFSMNAPKPDFGTTSYTMVINPPWNSTGISSRQLYSVTVAADNSVEVKLKSTNEAIGTITEGLYIYYPMTLAQPSVRGIVVNSTDVGVRDSWVVPINSTTGEYLWQQGANSRTGGSFGLSVADGNYRVQANVPWNSTGLANAAPCALTVAGGAISSSVGGCIQNDGSIKLALRAPNLTMNLKLNGVAVAFANVNIGLGNWNTNSQSNKDGKVSLFIDREAILAANPGLSGTAIDLFVTVDPPYGTSDMVRWVCRTGDAKPVCSLMSDLNATLDYPTTTLGDVEVLAPNTKVRVIDPITTLNVGANAWVSLLQYKPSDPNYGVRWIGGSNTDLNGYAAFNVDASVVDSDIRYKLEINPPGNKKADLSAISFNGNGAGLRLSEINNQNFNLGRPNAYISVVAPNTTSKNSWGWINVEEVDSNNQWIAWLGGFGLDNAGKSAVNLAANKRYRIYADPSGGREGARTECIVTTDASVVISLVDGLCNRGSLSIVNSLSSLQIILNAGNVVGTVKSPTGKLVVGATIYASVNNAPDDVDSIATSTNALGVFGLNLDPNKTWTIKIFPFNVLGATEVLANKTLNTSLTGWGGTADFGNITLALKLP